MKTFTSAGCSAPERRDGPTAGEYAVMLALIIVVCITAVKAMGTNATTPSPMRWQDRRHYGS